MRMNTNGVSRILVFLLRIEFTDLFSECKVQDTCVVTEVQTGPCPCQLIGNLTSLINFWVRTGISTFNNMENIATEQWASTQISWSPCTDTIRVSMVSRSLELDIKPIWPPTPPFWEMRFRQTYGISNKVQKSISKMTIFLVT